MSNIRFKPAAFPVIRIPVKVSNCHDHNRIRSCSEENSKDIIYRICENSTIISRGGN